MDLILRYSTAIVMCILLAIGLDGAHLIQMKILSFVHPHFLPNPQTLALVSVNSIQNISNHLFAANKCTKTKCSLCLMLVKVNNSLNPLSEVLVLKGS